MLNTNFPRMMTIVDSSNHARPLSCPLCIEMISLLVLLDLRLFDLSLDIQTSWMVMLPVLPFLLLFYLQIHDNELSSS